MRGRIARWFGPESLSPDSLLRPCSVQGAIVFGKERAVDSMGRDWGFRQAEAPISGEFNLI